tara:strand:- start:450 stop:776 length:327 start_codon:yes stop_codon:yes gene_type:complete
MNEIGEISKITLKLVSDQKDTFQLLWIIGTGIITTLIGVIGVLFKLYINSNKEKHSNEKETIRVLGDFSNGINDLNNTIKETNRGIERVLEKINNPIIPILNNLEKNK